jgi:hypothetical protein
MQRVTPVAEYLTLGNDGSIGIEPKKLPVPTNVYDADFAWPVLRYGAVSLFFGKADEPGVNGQLELRSRVEVRYPAESFFHHLWVNSREFHRKLPEILQKAPRWDGRDQINPAGLKAEREHSEWANFDILFQSGSQASLDFYLLPPSSLGFYNAVRKATGQADPSLLRVEPVLRVFTTTRELEHLLDACSAIADELEPLVTLDR